MATKEEVLGFISECEDLEVLEEIETEAGTRISDLAGDVDEEGEEE